VTNRPSRLCSCGRVVAHGVRCACQIAGDRARKKRHDLNRPTARQRGYDRQWQKAARAFLAEPANQFCACGAKAVLVRHKISIRKRPELRMVRSNWMPGCQRCNAEDTAKDRHP